jgi:hypothetical protein
MRTRQPTRDPLLWDFPQAARELNWPILALRGRVRRKQIPFLRIGQRIYFSPEHLRKWLAARIEGTAA